MVWGVCWRRFGIFILISWTVLGGAYLSGTLCGGILWDSGRSVGERFCQRIDRLSERCLFGLGIRFYVWLGR